MNTNFEKNKRIILWGAFCVLVLLLVIVFQVRSNEPLLYKSAPVKTNAASSLALDAGDTVGQSVVCDGDTFAGVSFALPSDPDTRGEWTISVAVRDACGVLLTEQEISSDSDRGGFYSVVLPTAQRGASGARFSFSLTLRDGALSVPVAADGGGALTHSVVYDAVDYNALTAGLALTALLCCGAAVWALCRKDFALKPERVFLLFFAVLGAFYLLALPLFASADELSHFLRAYEVSLGAVTTPNVSILPAGLSPGAAASSSMRLRYILDHFASVVDPGTTENYAYLNTALYTPVNYLPQATGIFLARLFTRNVWVLGYAAKLANLLSTGALLYYSIKYIPFGKNILLTVALLPMSMQGFASVSADGLTQALAFALTAFVLHLRYTEKNVLSRGERALLYLLPLALSLCKIAYIPLCLMLFIIPKERFRSKKDYYLNVAALGALIVGLNALWLAYAGTVLATPYTGGANAALQVSYVLGNLPRFVWTCVKTVLQNGGVYYNWMLGSMLGWLNISIPWVIVYGLTLCLLYAFCFDSGLKTPKKAAAWIFALCSFAVVALTFASLYVQFTPVGNGLVNGIQGRYFLPLLPLAAFVIKVLCPERSDEPRSMRGLYIALLCLNVGAAACVLIQTI